MTTVAFYNRTTERLAEKLVDYTALKVMLLLGATFTSTDLDTSGVAPFEVSGNGWPVGGPTLSGINVFNRDTDDAVLDANDVSITATGGDIGPADAYVIYDSVNDYALIYVDFEGQITAADGSPFRIIWGTDGLIRWSYGGI